MVIIRKNKRYGNSYCRICGKRFERGEKYIKLVGTYSIMRAKMCIEHFRVVKCKNCPDKLKCLTENNSVMCIYGKNKNTKVEEINY